ncbi:MAG: biotin/lipoyl-containing protein, partial [Rhodothermales bacterium]
MAKVDVTMPKMGESITEGTVLTWHKKPGDTVELDETLLEIGTDKVDTEVPSPAEGVLKEILVPEGETVDVGTVLAVLETEVESTSEDEPSDGPEHEAMGDGETNLYGGEADDLVEEEEEEEEAGEQELVEKPHLDVRPAGDGEVEVVMPKMGESITEGTVLTWHKQPGDAIELDETLLEIGTDKVDTEVPSPAAGILKEILVKENETVEVGTPLAVITTEAEAGAATPQRPAAPEKAKAERPAIREESRTPAEASSGDGAVMDHAPEGAGEIKRKGTDGRFYSPLVRSIAEKEGLSMEELESIGGSGREGRVTKADVLQYIEGRQQSDVSKKAPRAPQPAAALPADSGEHDGRVEVVKMDRMRQIIAEHMVRSKATSAHVTSFTEADVTNLVRQRERNRDAFEERE